VKSEQFDIEFKAKFDAYIKQQQTLETTKTIAYAFGGANVQNQCKIR
jgi:hypothetical protein